MFKRIALAAAAGLLATACASTTASTPDGGGPIASTPAGAATTPAGASAVTVLNIAASSQWAAEENLVPDDPMLALVGAGVTVTDNPLGVSATCNAANGGITMRVGKQDVTRVGQSATYRIRSGATMREVNGKFEQNRRAPDANFAFSISSADLLGIGQLDMVSFVSDKGEVEWTLVKDPASQVQAKYIGSLKGFDTAARDFLVYCNPK
jgi:hypothetical protein